MTDAGGRRGRDVTKCVEQSLIPPKAPKKDNTPPEARSKRTTAATAKT